MTFTEEEVMTMVQAILGLPYIVNLADNTEKCQHCEATITTDDESDHRKDCVTLIAFRIASKYVEEQAQAQEFKEAAESILGMPIEFK